jgi:capsular polysaccharide biosynthesis protein/Mrp family chromosome partitioning ATPase
MLESPSRASGPPSPSAEPADTSPAVALNTLLRIVGRHLLVFVCVAVVCVLAALGYLAHRSTTYSATAQILVTPIPATDTSYIGLPLIRAAELEPQRGSATAAPLHASAAADEATAETTGLTTAEVTAAVNIAAVSGSNLVAVTATGSSAAEATEIADAYARAAIKVRREFLKPQVRKAIADTERQRELLTDQVGAEANALGTRIGNLRTILKQGDPTLAFARPAPEGTAEGASSKVIILVAIFAGLVLGGLTTVMMELVAVRPLASEEDLSDIWPLPILARVPGGGRRRGEAKRRRWAREGAPIPVREAFRALRSQLVVRERERIGEVGGSGPAATVMLVSPEESESRTLASLELARSFAAAGEEATVVELDMNRPLLASLLDLSPRGDLSSLLRAEPAGEAVTALPGESRVGLIAAPAETDRETYEALSVNSGRLVEIARSTASWLVVDAPPVAEATADAVTVVGAAEHLVVVVVLGSTRPEALALLRETLAQQGRGADGYVVLSGTPASRASRAP